MSQATPRLGIVTGLARAAPCPTCRVVVDLAEVRYPVLVRGRRLDAVFWQQARHDCVPKRPIAAEFCAGVGCCADSYCEGSCR